MKKFYILIVDDEKDFRDMLKVILKEKLPCHCAEAQDGTEAIAYIKHNPCDCMILDIRMPKLSGIPVIEETKKIRPDIDILVVSGWLSDHVLEEAIEKGATDYITKPVDDNVLIMKLKTILGKRGGKKE